MITNKNLYEMIVTQMSNGNDALREQLKSQILDENNRTQTFAQELVNKQCNEFSELSKEINSRLNAIQIELKSEIFNAMSNNSEMMIQKIAQDYDEKIENLKSELHRKLDTQLYHMMSASKSLADGIANLQKDTAVIMEILQLILTNMMLNKVESEFKDGK